MSRVRHTPLTAELGCDYPVIQTAMGWVSTSDLVLASITSGAFGFLAAAVMTPEEAEAEVKRIKTATDRPFGVNFHAFQPGAERIVDLCIDYQVKAVSYGRAPSAKLIEKLKAAGIKCVPTIGAGKHARKAVEMGADILVCQGTEGGGHTGATPTWLLLAEVLDQVEVPVVACGGFRDGRGLAAALVFGAAGIAMGTRFLLTAESPVPEATKQAYLSARVTGIPVSEKLDGLPQRMVMNQTLARLEHSGPLAMLCRGVVNGLKYRSRTGASFLDLLCTAWTLSRKTDMTLGQTLMAANAPMLIQKAMVEGDPEKGILPAGQVAGLIRDLPSCRELIMTLIQEAESRLALIGEDLEQGRRQAHAGTHAG
tara:strand:+ start:2406 stop:3509 length:1104 start_codon:yes stop_codon:yes gene_type:complete